MNIVRSSSRPPSLSKLCRYKIYQAIYHDLADGECLWEPDHPEHCRHADILETIADETGAGDTTIREWWNSGGFFAIHIGDGPPLVVFDEYDVTD